ncbi:MAG: MotB family protein [Methylohalobius sp. ZOD2]
MAEPSKPTRNKPGAPAWVMTFADLMSLLLTFFVLMLSFATMDVIKFRQMAASLKNAFGVQTQIPAYETVKGTSVVAQHFTPSTVDPSPLEEIHQTTSRDQPELKIPEQAQGERQGELSQESIRQKFEQAQQEKLQAQAKKIRESLLEEIKAGRVSIETEKQKIVIRIHEKGSFPSGSAVLNAGFGASMKKIIRVVKNGRGKVIVAGHTDDVPISTDWYRSNWELSSARAVTVAHELLKGKIDPRRLVVAGYADTEPLVPNANPESRARNRRVEIILEQPGSEVGPGKKGGDL